jgi:tetratricopeptide (TPR) repeat protein
VLGVSPLFYTAELHRRDFRRNRACYYFHVERFSHARTSLLRHRSIALSAVLWGLLLPSPFPGRAFASAEPQDASFEELAKSAAAAREAGNVQQAMQDYRRAVQLRPDWTEGWWYLGTMAYDADHYAEAIPAFQKVVALAPAMGTAWTFLGLCEYGQKDYKNALAHLEKGKTLGDSEDANLARVAHFHLAVLRIREGAFTEGANLIAAEFSQGEMPAQAQFALGLAMLRVPLLPGEVSPSKDGLVQEAGKLAAQAISAGTGNFADAFPALLQKFPNTRYLHYAYGEALAASSREKEAAEAFQKEAEISPHSEIAKIAPGRVATNESAKARINEEVAEYYGASEHAAATPGGMGDAWNLALQDFTLHKYPDAIRDLTAVVQAKPDFGTAWAMLGLSEYELKQYDNARIHLEKGQNLGFGGSADSVRDARYHLALLLIRDGEFDRATSLLVPEAEASTLAGEIRFALGMALLRLPRLPEEVPAKERGLVDRAGEISTLLYNSKYDLALPKLKELLAEHPKTPFLHYAYGTALGSLSQFSEAQKQLLVETDISPKSQLPYLSLAAISLKLKRPEDALPYAKKALELAPRAPEPHYFLGRCYLDLERYIEAIGELEAAAKMAPTSAEVHFQLARAYTKAKQPEKAARERETFTRLNALVEKQRSTEGNQAYGAAHPAGDFANAGMRPVQSAPQ